MLPAAGQDLSDRRRNADARRFDGSMDPTSNREAAGGCTRGVLANKGRVNWAEPGHCGAGATRSTRLRYWNAREFPSQPLLEFVFGGATEGDGNELWMALR
jgi:hypothetical protein